MPQREEATGVVRDNNDPQMRGRLIVECPEIVSGEALGDWVEPKFHFIDNGDENAKAGCMWIPNIGATVTVSIEAGEDAEVIGLDPRWECTLYPDGTVPDEFQENYPNRRGWVTRAGHTLIFDDTEDSVVFYYKHPSGCEIRVTNDGGIQLSPPSGQSVLVGDGADQPIPLGTVLKQLLTDMKTAYDAHGHTCPAGGGATTALSNVFPTVDDTILSDDHKVK